MSVLCSSLATSTVPRCDHFAGSGSTRSRQCIVRTPRFQSLVTARWAQGAVSNGSRAALQVAASSGSSQQPAAAAPSTPAATPSSPAEVVAAFYTAVNAKDVETACKYIAEDCEYQDFTYPEPKRGRAAIRAFLTDVSSFVPDDLVYIVDDVTQGDESKVGVVWHVELDGMPFPNARGCSFYRINGKGQIVFARDIVESPLKLGDNAIQLLGVLAPLVRKFGPAGPSPTLGGLPASAALIWVAYFGYLGGLFFSPYFPGVPGTQTPPETFTTLLNMSINFGYVNQLSAWAGLPALPAGAEHPSYEALFTGIGFWSIMFLPAILADRRSAGIQNKAALWAGIFFGTNLAFVPFLALRAAQPAPGREEEEAAASRLPRWAPVVGWSSLAMLAASVAWGAAARPEFGGLAERGQYLAHMAGTDRVFWAFLLDATLYCVWQFILMDGAPTRLRLLPFVGMAVWLIGGGSSNDEQQQKPKAAE